MKTFPAMMKHLDGTTSFRDDCAGGVEWHLREPDLRIYRLGAWPAYDLNEPIPFYEEVPAYREPHVTKPHGLESGIAIQMEIDATVKRIQDTYAAMMPSPTYADAYEFKAGCHGEIKVHPAKLGQRHPAVEGQQYPAPPGVSYRVYSDLMRDVVLIVAGSQENLGWGRMVALPGQIFNALKKRTNAPEGEVALTDDDFETIINTMMYRPMHFQPWDPLPEEDGDEYDMAETTRLQRELFFSDPVLREHVGRSVDVNPKLFMSEEHEATFQKGLERAWELGWGGPTKTVESQALARACDRCDTIMNHRKTEDE